MQQVVERIVRIEVMVGLRPRPFHLHGNVVFGQYVSDCVCHPDKCLVRGRVVQEANLLGNYPFFKLIY